MTLVPYTKTTSRHSEDSNWSKILFRKDRKLQTTEIIEIQDLIQNQIKKVTKNLYDFYNIVKGCQVLLTNTNYELDAEGVRTNNNTYNYLMTDGQAFIEIKDVSSYVDIPSISFTVDNNSLYYIGVNFKVEVLKDDDETRGPFTGGYAFGELGADRLVIKATVRVYNNVYEDGGFYPIAIIKPKSKSFLDNHPEDIGGPPDIFYYRNTKVTSQYQDNYLPIFIEKKLQEVLYEISGDFIAEGLEINVKKEPINKELIVKVNTGVAYLKGRRLSYNYVTYKKYKQNNIKNNSIIYIYIDENGFIKLQYLEEEEIDIYSVNPFGLHIGTILNKNSNLQIIQPSENYMPEVSDIIKYKKQHSKNKRDLLDLSLTIDQLLLTTRGQNLTGIITDSFSSTKNSNTSHPLYNASIVPSIQAVSLPFVEFEKTIDSLIIQNESEIEVYRENNQIKTSSVTSGVFKINENLSHTRSIKLGVATVNSANLEVSPNIVYAKNTNLNVSYLPDNIVSTLSKEGINTSISKDIVEIEKTFDIKATGFSANEDNIILKVDSNIINTATLLKGTQPGSRTGTYKANESGHVYLKLTTLINTSNEILYIYLESSSTSASNQIKIVNLVETRAEQEVLTFTNPIPKLSSVKSGIAATFTTIEPTSLKGVEVIMTDFNNSLSLERSILDVYLTKTNFGLPTDEVIAKGSLELVDGIPVLNNFVEILFDRIAELAIGEYALIFNTTYENLSLAISVAGEDQVELSIAGTYNSSTNKLYSYNQNAWQEEVGDLTLKLIKRVPNSLTANTKIFVENVENFNALEINLPIEFTAGSQSNISIDNTFLNKNSFFFNNPINQATISVNTLGTSKTHPILELDNININLFSYRNNGTWVSINKEFARVYNQVEVSLDVYLPDNASFQIYFSSNQGQTWEELTTKNINNEYIYLEDFREVNRALPLFNYKFKQENLPVITFNGETIERTQLIIRVDLSVESLETLPFFKNVIALTY